MIPYSEVHTSTGTRGGWTHVTTHTRRENQLTQLDVQTHVGVFESLKVHL